MLADFGDVGLMTGDVTINPSATCLVMTTEASFLYVFGAVTLIYLVFLDLKVHAV